MFLSSEKKVPYIKCITKQHTMKTIGVSRAVAILSTFISKNRPNLKKALVKIAKPAAFTDVSGSMNEHAKSIKKIIKKKTNQDKKQWKIEFAARVEKIDPSALVTRTTDFSRPSYESNSDFTRKLHASGTRKIKKHTNKAASEPGVSLTRRRHEKSASRFPGESILLARTAGSERRRGRRGTRFRRYWRDERGGREWADSQV